MGKTTQADMCVSNSPKPKKTEILEIIALGRFDERAEKPKINDAIKDDNTESAKRPLETFLRHFNQKKRSKKKIKVKLARASVLGMIVCP
tara:strand:+ start:4469 stop:4738 length:270 start_codon:yes stop_codon:yes gene_type:complete